MREDILARGEDPALFPILNSQPELFQDLLWIWEGFMFLSSQRQIGMNGPQPISLTDVLSYCEYQRIDDEDDREEFLHHIHKLDTFFLADFRAKNPVKGSGGKPARLGAPN